MRRHSYDGDNALLTDRDCEYLLRRGDDGLRTYVAVVIDEAEKLARVALPDL